MNIGKIGVTGASGMLGRHFVAELESRGIDAVCCSRRPLDQVPTGARWVSWDISQTKNSDELEEQFSDCDAIIHTAAVLPGDTEDRALMFATNVSATRNLASWAQQRSVPLVFISSAAVYSDPHASNIKENAARGGDGLGGYYADTKCSAERELERMASDGLKLIVLRPSALYGLGARRNSLIMRLIIQAQAGEVIDVEKPATGEINFVHAADVVGAALFLLERNATGIFNIGYPKLYTMRDVAETCVSVVGKGDIRYSGSRYDREPFRRFDLNLEKLQSEIGYKPAVDLKTGISKMVAGHLR